MAAAWSDFGELDDEPGHLGDPADMVDAAGLLVEMLARPAWHADAACREHPEVSWFPERGESLEPARKVCRGCLVRSECLDYAQALTTPPDGVWASLSLGERRTLHQDPQRPPTEAGGR